jgi:hypothetical protein
MSILGSAQIVPAKFVNLFEFCEFKIFPKPEEEIFFSGGPDQDRVVRGFDFVDIRPKEELASRQSGDGNAGVMEGKQLLRPEAHLTVKKKRIGHAQGKVDDSRPVIGLYEHQDTDAQEKNDFHQAEEEIDPGYLSQDISAGQYEDKNIEGNQ